MRTTIEITAEQRSQLLAIAASRGMKGFSRVVQEALDEYLAARKADKELVARALSTKGALDEEEAFELAEACTELRKHWR